MSEQPESYIESNTSDTPSDPVEPDAPEDMSENVPEDEPELAIHEPEPVYHPTIHVVDDDQSVRGSIAWLIESVGLGIRTYGSANEFLSRYSGDDPGCLVLDVRMPGMSGLELQQTLLKRGIDLPIIFITGHGDVPMAVRALKRGAVDFIEKPFNDQALLDTIQAALHRHREQLQKRRERALIKARYDSLSLREHQALEGVVQGLSNRDISEGIGISVKTIEVHRGKMMKKMTADSVADLVRMMVLLREEEPGES
jgi:FixJ family two-component response regulator